VAWSGNLYDTYTVGLIDLQNWSENGWNVAIQLGKPMFGFCIGAPDRAWGEFASASVGLALGIAEAVIGAAGEIFSGGLSTAIVIDGLIRVGSNYKKILEVGRMNSVKAKATPSNAGAWAGKGLDWASGKSYNDIGVGQLVGGFANDFVTFAATGGNVYNVIKMIENPSGFNVVNYAFCLSGVPYTTYSDISNYYYPNH
jgi:hypothetical protein